MKRVGKGHYLHQGETTDVCVQYADGLVTLGVRDETGWSWMYLTPDEANKVAKWLLRAADKAERYTPDE